MIFASNLQEVKCLMYYDGPILSHFKGENKANTIDPQNPQDYLVVWTDIDDKANYWHVIEVSPHNMDRYLGNFISLRDVMARSHGIFACKGMFIDDIGQGAGERVEFADISEDHLPTMDSYLRAGSISGVEEVPPSSPGVAEPTLRQFFKDVVGEARAPYAERGKVICGCAIPEAWFKPKGKYVGLTAEEIDTFPVEELGARVALFLVDCYRQR